MRALDVVAIAAVVVMPAALFGPLAERRNERIRPFYPGISSILLGVVAALLAVGARRVASRFLHVDEPHPSRSDPVEMAYALLLLGPLDEALRLVATLPGLRAVRGFGAMRVSIGSALGFASVLHLARLTSVLSEGGTITASMVGRVALDTAAHVALTSLWGFAVGRDRKRGIGGTKFSVAFTAAVGLGSTVTYLVFARGPNALAAAVPVTLLACLASLVARRDLRRLEETRRSGQLSRLLPVAPPSIAEVEELLERRPDRPLATWRITLGALVTTGVLVTALALCVYAGHRIGVDFSAIDERTGLEQSGPPLVLLGLGVFGAFPVAGFLVAKATASLGVLEPALGASLALVAIVIALGIAAPIAVVFAVALAPVAFALTCAGAWTGLDR